MKGKPWIGTAGEATDARRTNKALMAMLYSHGWVLKLNTDISKTQFDKDILMFRLKNPVPTPVEWLSIAFCRSDWLQFIDAPAELYRSVSTKLGPLWVKAEKELDPGVWKIKLNGNPWWPSGEAAMGTKVLLLTLVETLEQEGWRVYASVQNVSIQGQGAAHHDTWHCYR